MSEQVVRHGGGAAFRAPDDWQVVVVDATTVLALEPDRPGGGFRANLVLTVVPNNGLSFAEWQNGTDTLLDETLTDYQLLDLAELEVAGRPGGRRLAHHLAENADALVMEQWFTDHDDVGYTLTATIDVLRYDAAADDLAALATTLELP